MSVAQPLPSPSLAHLPDPAAFLSHNARFITADTAVWAAVLAATGPDLIPH
jgi:hypothetical protein